MRAIVICIGWPLVVFVLPALAGWLIARIRSRWIACLALSLVGLSFPVGIFGLVAIESWLAWREHNAENLRDIRAGVVIESWEDGDDTVYRWMPGAASTDVGPVRLGPERVTRVETFRVMRWTRGAGWVLGFVAFIAGSIMLGVFLVWRVVRRLRRRRALRGPSDR